MQKPGTRGLRVWGLQTFLGVPDLVPLEPGVLGVSLVFFLGAASSPEESLLLLLTPKSPSSLSVTFLLNFLVRFFDVVVLGVTGISCSPSETSMASAKMLLVLASMIDGGVDGAERQWTLKLRWR